MDDLNHGIEELVRVSIERLNPDLKAVFLFGSGNSKDFIRGLSDLDFIYLLSHIDYDKLTDLSKLRDEGHNLTGYCVDIKPFTLDEFVAGINGKGTFEFFNGWGLEMIKRGHQRCLYKTEDVSLNYEITPDRIKSDSLERAHYYITKLRKVLGSTDSVILRGQKRVLDSSDLLKVCASAIKNVLTFCLAYRGEFAYLTEEVMGSSESLFGDIRPISGLMKQKNNRVFDPACIIAAYNNVERIYQQVVGDKLNE